MVETAPARKGAMLDRQVRETLHRWPQRPPGIQPSLKQPGTWLKARPNMGSLVNQPYLKFPGSNQLKTLPDGLYLHFSPRPEEPYVDILCIEACSTYQNLLDKRSRFAPSTGSLLVVCPVDWLMQPIGPGSNIPRWRLIRTVMQEPRVPLVLPVRDARVLFALRKPQYVGFASSQTAHPHEFFCPMDALIGDGRTGGIHPGLQALMARAAAAANFMELPEPLDDLANDE